MKKTSFLFALLVISCVYLYALIMFAIIPSRYIPITWEKIATIVLAGIVSLRILFLFLWSLFYMREEKSPTDKVMPRDFFSGAVVIFGLMLATTVSFLPRPWNYHNWFVIASVAILSIWALAEYKKYTRPLIFFRRKCRIKSG